MVLIKEIVLTKMKKKPPLVMFHHQNELLRTKKKHTLKSSGVCTAELIKYTHLQKCNNILYLITSFTCQDFAQNETIQMQQN